MKRLVVTLALLVSCGPMEGSRLQENVADTPAGRIDCPFGYQITAVGNAGGVLCTNFQNAWGPFTRTMIQRCRSYGGGEPCESMAWDKELALALRGTGLCPNGARFDRETGYCVEGQEAFGPFPPEMIARCVALGGGQGPCKSARWHRSVLLAVLN